MAGYTVSIWATKGLREHVPALESLRRMIETGDGPCIHPVNAADERDEFEAAAAGAEVVALIIPPHWSEGYINTRAKLLAEKYGAGGRLVAVLGVPRKRLSPEVQALVKWVLY